MNGALILKNREDIMPVVECAIEAFTDDILPAIACKGISLSCQVDEKHPDVLVIKGTWLQLDKPIYKEFRLQVIDTANDFIHSVKAYLFDLLVAITNL